MRKILTILVVVIGLVVIARQLLPGAGGSSDVNTPISEAPYVVIRQTGVYLANNGDAPAYLLEPGMLLKPAGSASELDCRPVVIADETVPVCQVEVVLSGRWGWVAQADFEAR